MEELKHELEKLSKAYKDTPEKEEKVLIPFIKRLLELPMKERRKLLPTIRELQWITGKFAGFSSSTFCSQDRACFLGAVQFVCCNKREMDLGYHINFHLFCKLLSLYTPSWLTEYINDGESYMNFNISYEELMQFTEMGYIKEISPNRIAQMLPGYIMLKPSTPKGDNAFDSDLLLKREITLKEHIWYLFEQESSIVYYNDRAKEAYKKGITPRDESFSAAFYRFSLDGHLDRNQLLKTTLSAFQRSFKKDMIGWFAALFEELQPTTEEILSLQEDMMQVFTSSYTKPVNVMLQQLKKVVVQEGFRYQEFTERATTLFFSSPKNSLLTIHALFEQIATRHPEMKETCCITLCQLFLKKDESLQKKAAHFILKYGDAASSVLQEALQSYQPEMFQKVKESLAAFIKQSDEEAGIIEENLLPENMPSEAIRICREDNRIALPGNKEDFLFQLSRLFDMGESWEIDTTIASIIAFHPQLNADDFSRMEPVFQRAFNIVANGWEVYEDLIATFLLEYERLWTHTNNSITGFLKNVFARLKEKDETRGAYDERSFRRLADWQPAYSDATCFTPIRQLWLEAIRKIKERDTLPLLSTPTHSPAYIQATELVKRLAAYQKASATPSTWDLQLAIARCAPEDKEEAISLAQRLLKDEYLHLCQFLLDENTMPEPPYINQPAWVVAGLVKDPDTEIEAFRSFSCNTLPHHYLAGIHEWKEPKPKKDPYPTNALLLDVEFYKWKKYLEHNSHQLWQEHLIINSRYNIGDSNYMERLFCCFPNRPEPLVTQIVTCYMDFGTPQEDSKRCITCALHMLLSFHCPLREMSLLLLGGSLLFADKTVRSYAAELWIEGITAGRIDNQRLGEILARILCMDIAPLKRFTTQIYESMYKRSAFHNQRLEDLLATLLGRLPEKPVTGLKQLLELYLELLNINRSKVTDKDFLQRLQAWTKNSNLKKVATSIIQVS
jgi:hypothetical protein